MKTISSILLSVAIIATNVRQLSPSIAENWKTCMTTMEVGALLATAEKHHFTPAVENLRHGATGTIGADLGYVLLMFPNHHRALAAFGKLSLRDKTLKPAGAPYSVGCFFDRAIRFKPNDGTVRMVYGNYLLKAGQPDQATEQLRIAAGLQPETPRLTTILDRCMCRRRIMTRRESMRKKRMDWAFRCPASRTS